MAYKNPIFKGIYNLLLGLKVTLGYLFSRAITLQYPDERWEMPERSRGVVVLLSDQETGELNCTACTLCQKACPTAAIRIERFKGEDKKWKVKSFDLDNTICCYCGFCEEACNFDALKLTPKYEFSSYDKESLVYDMHRLQELGLDVKYTPRRKKKPVAKPTEEKPATGDEIKPSEVKPEAKTELESPEEKAETKDSPPETDEKKE